MTELVAPLVSIHVVGLPDRMGQAFTYWRLTPEVSPDEGFRREAETSINSMLFFVVLE